MQAGELTTEGTFYWMKIKGDTEWKELNEQNGQPSSRCTHQHNALSISKAMILINYLGSSSGQGQWLVVDQWLGVQRHIPHRIKNQGNRWGEEIATARISLRYPFSKRKQPKWRRESAYPVWGASGLENILCPIFSTAWRLLAGACPAGPAEAKDICVQAGCQGETRCRAWGLASKVKRGISNEFFFQEIFSSDA